MDRPVAVVGTSKCQCTKYTACAAAGQGHLHEASIAVLLVKYTIINQAMNPATDSEGLQSGPRALLALYPVEVLMHGAHGHPHRLSASHKVSHIHHRSIH